MANQPVPADEGKTFFGHPRGLFVLFFAEMWERFSYYGMRGLLIFYLIQHWLFSDGKASLIYGAYTALVYIAPVIGGYMADKFIGQRKAVQYGAVLLVIGHGLMAIEGNGGQSDPTINVFWLALAFIIMGVGFLKANISAIVGELYGQGDPRRDPGFTIFYMGINVGALLAALVAVYLGQTFGWAWGFGSAGVGMLLGLIVFVWGRPWLMGKGEMDNERLTKPIVGIPTEWMIYLLGLVGVVVAFFLVQYQSAVGWLLGITGLLVVGYFLYTAVLKMDRVDRDRILAALFLIGLQPLFWALFEQAGASLSLYTQREVDRVLFGWEVPAGMFQSINPGYIILLGPLFAWLWLWLSRRNWEPSTPAKFGIGIVLLGAGFLVLQAGAEAANINGALTPVLYIFLIYLFATMGELCLSPVGLSAMTKLAPSHMVGLLMGTWFMSTAAGNFLAGVISKVALGGAGHGVAAAADTSVITVYGKAGWVAVGVGVAVVLVSPFIHKLMHEDVDNAHHDRVLAGQSEIGEPAAAGTRTDKETR